MLSFKVTYGLKWILSATTIITTFLSLPAPSAPRLKVWMETPRSEFRFCEQISVYLFVVNTDVVEAVVPYADGRSRGDALRMDFRREGGDPRRYMGPAESSREDSVRLAPGDTVMFLITPTDGYSEPDPESPYPLHIAVGQYVMEAIYFRDYPVAPINFRVVPLNAQEESVLRGLSLAWSTPPPPNSNETAIDVFRRAYVDRFNTSFCSRFGSILLLSDMDEEKVVARRVSDARLVLDRCAEGKAGLCALSVLLRAAGENEFKTTMLEYRALFHDKYFPYLLKGLLRVNHKMNLYEEVMKDVAKDN